MSTTKYPAMFTKKDYRKDTPEERDRKISALVRAMTWEEKLSLLGGSREPEEKGKIGNAGYQWGVPRLGVPEVVMYDGPAGITGIVETTGLPQPSLLGCTWDEEMAYEFGKAAAEECAACSGNFLLAPQLDVIRSPHFARNKDMKSEDSYLGARLGAAETKGVQENGAVATIKHFTAANLFGTEFLHFPKQVVDEQTLHETYCRTFDAAIHESGAGSVMNAYNDVNGSYCSANRELLTDILRDQWDFQGSVMSDWGSVHAFTLDAGMDIEMPFPAFNSKERVEKKIERGRISRNRVDEAVRRVLFGMSAIGLLSLVRLDEDGEVMEDPDHPLPIQMEWRYEEEAEAGMLDRHAEAAAAIVREGTVLLKNENGALPLDAAHADTTVLIGTGAVYPVCGQAQERSFGTLARMRSGREAMEAVSGRTYRAYAGIDYVGVPIPADVLFRDEACREPGLTRTYGILEADRDPMQAEQAAPETAGTDAGGNAAQANPGGGGQAAPETAGTDAGGNAAQANPGGGGQAAPETPGTDAGSGAAQANPGGGGQAFQGTVQYDEDGDPVNTGLSSYNCAEFHYPEDYPLGQPAGVDACIDFTCGRDAKDRLIKNYRNGPAGTAFGENESYTWKGYLRAPETGDYDLLLECVGGEASFFIRTEEGWRMPGKSLMREWAQWPWESLICTPEGMGITGDRVTLEAGKVYPILVHARQCVRNKDLQVRLAWAVPSWKEKNYADAIHAAAEADTILFYACDGVLNADAMLGALSGKIGCTMGEEQRRLLGDVLAARKPDARVIVVMQTSNARAIADWADEADAILTAYLPGQEGAGPVAEILLGQTNPAGKLSQTWPAFEEDTPLTDTPAHTAERGTGVPYGDGDTLIRMSEGIFTGYRWYDKYKVTPLFPFGHGLSYTSFAYSDLQIRPAGDTFAVSLKVTNTGDRTGDEIVQVYLGKAPVPEHIQMAEKQLAAFARLKDIAPGETRETSMIIDLRMLCYWDPAMLLQTREDGTKDKWVRAAGRRTVLVGASSADIRLEGEIEVN